MWWKKLMPIHLAGHANSDSDGKLTLNQEQEIVVPCSAIKDETKTLIVKGCLCNIPIIGDCCDDCDAISSEVCDGVFDYVADMWMEDNPAGPLLRGVNAAFSGILVMLVGKNGAVEQLECLLGKCYEEQEAQRVIDSMENPLQ